MLFMKNNATVESAWTHPAPSEGSVGDDIDLKSHMDFLFSRHHHDIRPAGQHGWVEAG